MVLSRGFGRSRPEGHPAGPPEAVGPDSVFLLASISKAFAAMRCTAPAAAANGKFASVFLMFISDSVYFTESTGRRAR